MERNMPRENKDGKGSGGGGPVGLVFKGLAAGVGLVSESLHHRKEKKAQKEGENVDRTSRADRDDSRESRHPPGHDADIRISQADESTWRLDEAQDEVAQAEPSYRATVEPEEDGPRSVDTFLQAHPLPSHFSPTADHLLEMPVVITQRRPGTRQRGFVRAYAPILQDVGIDQSAFLEFIDKLNKAVEPSPWIQAVNLASLAGNAAPEPTTVLISAAVKVATDMASEVHSRTKTNKFLDNMNASYFAPRGLVALVMTWQPKKPDELVVSMDFNLTSSITRAAYVSSAGDNWWKNAQRKLEPSSGATSFEFPETAPLVFPVLDELVEADAQNANDAKKKKKKQSAIKSGGLFVESYFDKRARAKWAGKNPDSKMATAAPKETFKSRYADPNHSASSGDPIAFITAGNLQSFGGLKRGNSQRGRGFGRGFSGPNSRILGSSRGGGRGQSLREGHRDSPAQAGFGAASPLGLIAGAGKLLQSNVLYLLIVPRPTEEQLAAVGHD